jgi:aryl-alcohol dehydrogenase-like predicted oxidoreductase
VNQAYNVNRESVEISGTPIRASRIGLGTWAMGGSMWGGTDSLESVATIRAAVEQGINLIDTAPAYGFGVSEEIVGKALAGALCRGVTRAAIDRNPQRDDHRSHRARIHGTPESINADLRLTRTLQCQVS